MLPSSSDRDLLLLTEARLSAPVRLNPGERRVLEDHFEAKITTELDESYRVRPGSVVGSVQIGARTVVVEPKLRIDRVLFMTAYTADPHRSRDQWSTIAAAGNLTDGIAALFLTAYQRTVAQGLLRAYRTVESDETTIRGRIRWPRQARRPGPLPIAVRYQVHDDDIVENQILRTVVRQLRRQRITDPTIQAGLARAWQQLRDLTRTPATPSVIDRLTWTRHNAHYRPILNLARIILAASMPDLDVGAVPVVGFTLRLYDVFEQFVRTVLREAVDASLSDFPDNAADHQLYLDTDRRIRLEPDLGHHPHRTWAFIGDVKYKTDTGNGLNPDLYQLLAYATAAGLPEATLIYADGPPQRRSHRVRHRYIDLHIHHLNLDRPPTHVLRDLADLAAQVRHQSTQGTMSSRRSIDGQP
jgi:5-methylcytosine-specific restriction enzyme subunit McrC